MTPFVLDASIAVKWFLPAASEPYAIEAIEIFRDFERGRIRLLAPDLLGPEFGNVLWKAVRQGRLSRSIAEGAIERLTELGIPMVPSGPLLIDAFAIATAHQRSFYDSLYLALAVTSRAPLLTADERLVNALASRFPVRWLGML